MPAVPQAEPWCCCCGCTMSGCCIMKGLNIMVGAACPPPCPCAPPYSWPCMPNMPPPRVPLGILLRGPCRSTGAGAGGRGDRVKSMGRVRLRAGTKAAAGEAACCQQEPHAGRQPTSCIPTHLSRRGPRRGVEVLHACLLHLGRGAPAHRARLHHARLLHLARRHPSIRVGLVGGRAVGTPPRRPWHLHVALR